MKPYYSLEKFELYHKDCIEFMDNTPENSIDVIFADPPYNLSNDGFSCHSGKRVSVNKGKWDESEGIDKDFQSHMNWIGSCKRILKENGSIWISGTYHSIYACGFALQSSGYHLLNDICWYKSNAPPNLSGRYFTASHETLLWARKSKGVKHIFNYDLMKNGNWPEDSLKNPSKQMRSVWSISSPKPSEKKFGKHPTQKPLDLLKRIVLASSNEGDIILDPFTGSSTTGLAAYLLNREFIGIDIEKEYLDLSVKRFKDLRIDMEDKKKQQKLFDVDDEYPLNHLKSSTKASQR